MVFVGLLRLQAIKFLGFCSKEDRGGVGKSIMIRDEVQVIVGSRVGEEVLPDKLQG